MFTCEFCKKEFSFKGNMLSHQKHAKYCLEMQGKIYNNNFDCKFCSKMFTTQQNLNDHLKVCKDKDKKEYEEKLEIQRQEYEEKLEIQRQDYEEKIKKRREEYEEKIEIIKLNNEKSLSVIIKEKSETISKLEAKLEKFEDNILSKTEKKPITTNNTTNNIVINNNYLNLNDITKMSAFLEEKLDKDVVAGGQKGLAFLLSNTVLKDKYKCVDPSRQNFEFTNELGEVERDVKAKKLTNALIKSDICSRSGDKGLELWKKEDGSTDSLRYQAHSKNVMEMINFTIDNSTFRSELSALTS